MHQTLTSLYLLDHDSNFNRSVSFLKSSSLFFSSSNAIPNLVINLSYWNLVSFFMTFDSLSSFSSYFCYCLTDISTLGCVSLDYYSFMFDYLILILLCRALVTYNIYYIVYNVFNSRGAHLLFDL